MTISYGGKNKDFETRCALIAYDDENEKEVHLVERIVNYLEKVLSYNVNQACSGLYIIVVEDRKEYAELTNEYKRARKCFTQCTKYGF